MLRRWRHSAMIASLIIFVAACSSDIATTARRASGVLGVTSTVIAASNSALTTSTNSIATTEDSATSRTPITASTWASLATRPLHMPALAPGGGCPVTAWHAATTADPAGGFAPTAGFFVLGNGPIYPIIYNFVPDKGAISFAKLPDFGAGGKQDKVLWLSSPVYSAPALIHGRQIDGTNTLSFGPTASAPTELRFPRNTGVSSADTASGWRDRPSYMVIPAPGCYAFQVDGASFSDVIVFTVGP